MCDGPPLVCVLYPFFKTAHQGGPSVRGKKEREVPTFSAPQLFLTVQGSVGGSGGGGKWEFGAPLISYYYKKKKKKGGENVTPTAPTPEVHRRCPAPK